KTIADEMIARAAETKSKAGFIQRIFDEIIRLLNKFGIAKGLVSRAELNALIRLSEKNLQKPISEPVAGDGADPLLAKEDAPVFAPMVLQAVRDLGFEDSITPDGKLKVFHGSSESNINKILKSGEFKGFPFFALDRETAEKFSRQAGGKSKVIELIVDPDIVVPTGGYLSARIEGLKLQEDGTWSADAGIVGPSILFSRDERAGVAQVGDSLGMPEETYTETAVRWFQNSFNRVKKLQETIIERGGTVSDVSDVYGVEERHSSKISYRLSRLDKGHMKPLLKQMDSDGITIEELDKYLIAKHAAERNAYIASINPDMQDGGSGITNAEAAEIIDSFADKADTMEEAAKRVYAVNE
ncbi:MAG: hypothetical protein KAT90_10395, partial [Gammaproteobacteria bacterium]|nr:hypothetical protein [Gammaproteobacteria bacterium]